MIHYLMSKGGDDNVKRAKELADAIRDRNNPPSVDAMNRIYDVVLNMNSLNSKPSDGNSDLIFTVNRCFQVDSRRKAEGNETARRKHAKKNADANDGNGTPSTTSRNG